MMLLAIRGTELARENVLQSNSVGADDDLSNHLLIIEVPL